MPYTPPSKSPATSAPASPDVSRRPSFQTGSRPSLPRSASYLTRHRRTPSAVGAAPTGNATNDQPTPPGTCDDLKSLLNNSSIRQSPPPRTGDVGMPAGAMISPPDSSTPSPSSSSDDEQPPSPRGRDIQNLKELQQAISQIPQHRQSSPNRTDGRGALSLSPVKTNGRTDVISRGFSTSSLSELSRESPRSCHSRSHTHPEASVIKSADSSSTCSDEESDGDLKEKPQMVRKKSGELVRPALRASSQRRPSSMPGTPTFAKAVHFDSHLEHVRHFLQVDRPLAVSAGSSPADTYDSDAEYPFSSGDEKIVNPKGPSYELEIIKSNFPADTDRHQSQPVRLETVWLSNDQKCLIGSIAVANLAFQKQVTCRFTLDYWKTTSEVGAEFSQEILPRTTRHGIDRFNFTIKLSDLANLETKTLFFCIRYNVNGQEYWDNNSRRNFQVDFRKKFHAQNGKQNPQARHTSGSLPRSTRRPNPSTAPRPKSMPISFDAFGDEGKLKFDQPIHELVGDSGKNNGAGLRLKGVKSTTSLPSDNLSSRLTPPRGQAFANRYDFGASLSAAMQAAKEQMSKPRVSEGLYMKSNKRSGPLNSDTTPRLLDSRSDPTGLSTISSSGPAVSGASISSSTYDEFLSKYCFFGSKQSSPQLKDGILRGGRVDSGDEAFVTRATGSTASSSLGSPGDLARHQLPHLHQYPTAMHHSLNLPAIPRPMNPYFQHANPQTGSLEQSATITTNSALPLSAPRGAPLATTAAAAPTNTSAGEGHSSQTVMRVATPPSERDRSVSPAKLVGGFAALSTSPTTEYPYHGHHSPFPFTGGETHTATAY